MTSSLLPLLLLPAWTMSCNGAWGYLAWDLLLGRWGAFYREQLQSSPGVRDSSSSWVIPQGPLTQGIRTCRVPIFALGPAAAVHGLVGGGSTLSTPCQWTLPQVPFLSLQFLCSWTWLSPAAAFGVPPLALPALGLTSLQCCSESPPGKAWRAWCSGIPGPGLHLGRGPAALSSAAHTLLLSVSAGWPGAGGRA